MKKAKNQDQQPTIKNAVGRPKLEMEKKPIGLRVFTKYHAQLVEFVKQEEKRLIAEDAKKSK